MRVCSLFSGSSGNCIYVGNENTHLLIDGGHSGKKILTALEDIGVNPSELDGILVTHEHSDHIKGVGILSRKLDVPVYATGKTWQAMQCKLGDISLKNTREIEAGQDFYINDMDVSPISIPHDAIDPVFFSVMHKGKKVSVCTDLGYITKSVYAGISDSDALLIEANHDLQMLQNGSYPERLKRRISGRHGHLSNETCANVLTKLAGNVRQVLLGHLSGENNTASLAYKTVTQTLAKNGIHSEDMSVDVLSREMHSHIYII